MANPRALSGKVSLTERKRSGFTLIELLVVVVVLGILLGSAVISMNLGGDQRGMQAYGQRMAQRIELARDRAIQNNQEWGLRVTQEEYLFVVFDELQGQWIPQPQPPFKPDEPPQPVLYDLRVQDGGSNELSTGLFAQAQDNDQQTAVETDSQELPDVVFFSSGEASQFALEVTPENAAQDSVQGFRLVTDGFSPMALEGLDGFRGGGG